MEYEWISWRKIDMIWHDVRTREDVIVGESSQARIDEFSDATVMIVYARHHISISKDNIIVVLIKTNPY